ncbi:unnamed protein product [Rhizoctonia solani]|uniref:ubiquitinyl hydrolase 1 n=1 Tax=Rhizoctonia solani TaxID=456999 RepID=A0A8H3DK75_9AGAM|nr:unnamed protein product [Rhizoctonia solani]
MSGAGEYDVWAACFKQLVAYLPLAQFTPPDLAQIAHELDQLEQGVQDSRGGKSTNMDDTGYFSVQVLENALKNAFGLTLVRWRSAEMRQYQAVPDTQLGFVLNLEQHWFTLRRFGHPRRKGHWFNLNSFLGSPEWVGNTYLGMVLQEAEKEGYSVFVVRPLDPSNPEHTLPETEADLLAETLDPGDFGGQVQRISTTRTQPGSSSSNTITATASSSAPAGFENEDVELQRALQASIAAGYGGGSIYEFPDEPPASTSRAAAPPVRASSLGLGYGGDSGPPSRRTPVPAADDPPTPNFEDDPVAASAARARLRLEQMQREQAAALQGLGGGYDVVELDPAAAARRREAQDRVRRARDEEEEQVRQAMEASLRTHQQDSDDENLSRYDTPPTVPGAFGIESRNYDDEDAELQAALRASLESHTAPSAAPAAPSGSAVSAPAPRAPAFAAVRSPSAVVNPPAPSVPVAKPAEDDEDEEEEEEEEQAPAPSSPEVQAKAEVADPDELRRRRLARFGG